MKPDEFTTGYFLGAATTIGISMPLLSLVLWSFQPLIFGIGFLIPIVIYHLVRSFSK